MLLAEPTPESRLGNLAADFVKHREIAGLPEGVRRGIKQHQQIDSFTDRHPVVQRSIRRLSERWGWFTGIIIDVYYDHLLALSWSDHCPLPLEEFTAEVNEDLLSVADLLPPMAEASVRRIAGTDRLRTYRELGGVVLALIRLTHILRERIPNRAVDLLDALPDLATHHAELTADFAEFFPELAAFSNALGSLT